MKVIALIMAIVFVFTVIACGPVYQKPKIGDTPRLAKIQGEKSVIVGVCSGLAYWTGTPAWIWRASFFLFTIAGGCGILIYIIMWAFMPSYDGVPDDYNKRIGG